MHSRVVGSKTAQKVEGSAIQPLQIVYEDYKRMFGLCKYANEALQDALETRLRLLRREICNGLLGTDDQFDLGNEVDYELRVRAKG
jgi:hypothetical protein